ncbi:MAG: hypothetical protein H6819_04410 [Phycisphaerales bacterium]|nr:hypothetical protein [Phycisphaerales bacterium]MCB9856442.1 hypothetical protein [Phycisphaerales bacterium]
MTNSKDPDDAPRLAADLRNLYRSPGPIPDAVRDEIAHQARAGLSDLSRTRRWGGIALIATAAAIVFAFQFVLQQMATPDRREMRTAVAPPAAITQREDIDGNGRIDILDAFVLAKRVDAQSQLNPSWDFNADGRVDRKDVDSVAQVAVQLNGGA